MLNIPLVGFLPGSDERVTGTIDAISRELGRDGFVARYSTAETDDGLPGGEGQFLACSFWLVHALALNGRVDEARALFERLLGLSNDLGLLAEEYDVERAAAGRQLPAGVQPPDPHRGGLRARRRRGRHRPGRARGRTDGGSTMKTVIVGGVAAGASTGARLRRLDESAEIVVLERDHYVSFANCGLPYHIGGAIPERDSLLLQTPESLGKSLALDVRTGQDVLRIDRDAKEVEVRDLAEDRTYRESYDKLVLCPGAEPIRPPIPGADDPRVDVLRNIPDMDRIIARLDEDATSAVVVGGSYIGLELTEAFRARGLQTTVVERTERLMPWLDPEMTRILDYHVAHPRRGPAARHVGQRGSPRRRRPARARSLRRHVGRGRRGGDGGRGASQRRARP